MKFVRVLVVWCIVIVTVGAIGTGVGAAASVGPEWGRCVEDTQGRYSDAGCTEKAGRGEGGGFEWLHAKGIIARKIVGTGTEAVFEGVSGHTIRCDPEPAAVSMGLEIEPVEPQVNGLERVTGSLAFRGCVDSVYGPCEEITTTGLEGRLGFISGAGSPDPMVGLDMRPVNGRVFAPISCGGHSITIGRGKGSGHGGSVISQLEPIDQMTTSFTETYSGAGGAQDPAKLETGKEDTLEASFGGPKGKFERSALKLTFVTTSEEPIEIRAYCKGC